jgi:hypothetical protein
MLASLSAEGYSVRRPSRRSAAPHRDSLEPGAQTAGLTRQGDAMAVAGNHAASGPEISVSISGAGAATTAPGGRILAGPLGG